MSNALVPINHDSTGKPTVNARDLHESLQVGKFFANWIKDRIEQFGFVENQDFVVIARIGNNPKGGPPKKEYHLSLDMAKELAMVERNDRGKQIRQYFIEVEKDMMTLSPERILLRQTQILVEHAERQKRLEEEHKRLEAEQIELSSAQIETSNRLHIVESKLKDSPGYYSITGYANIIGIKVTDAQAKVFGKAAAKLSRELEIPISKTNHTRWGLVNIYHESVLSKIMSQPPVALKTIRGGASRA